MLPVSAGLTHLIPTPPSPRPPHIAGHLWAFAGSSQHTAPMLTAPPAAAIATQAQTHSHRDTRQTCAHEHRHRDTCNGHGHTDMHVCAHTCTHGYVHIDTGMHKHTGTHTGTQTHRHMPHMHTQICTRTHRGVLTNVHMHPHTCTWTHAHKAHMDTDTCRHTHGHTHTCTGIPALNTLLTQQLSGPPRLLCAQAPLVLSAWVQP